MKGKNTELQKNYKDDNFHYSCPNCRDPGLKKKRTKKDLHKRNSCYSNSLDNESVNNKNVAYQDDVNMANVNSQLDDDMVEESYMSQTDKDRKSCSELEVEGYHQTQSDLRKGDPRKRKQMKKLKSRQEKIKKLIKRSPDDYNSPSYRSNKETVEDFTRYRSLKIAKEREDIVESRSLGMKVSLF